MEGKGRGKEPNEICRRISDDGAGGAVVGRGGGGTGVDGNVGGRRDGEVNPANGVASDDRDFLPGQSPTSSHCRRRNFLFFSSNGTKLKP